VFFCTPLCGAHIRSNCVLLSLSRSGVSFLRLKVSICCLSMRQILIYCTKIQNFAIANVINNIFTKTGITKTKPYIDKNSGRRARHQFFVLCIFQLICKSQPCCGFWFYYQQFCCRRQVKILILSPINTIFFTSFKIIQCLLSIPAQENAPPQRCP